MAQQIVAEDLLTLWEQLAVCWTDTDRGERLRKDVIARMQADSTNLASLWLQQALALASWSAISGELHLHSASVESPEQWSVLQNAAEQLRQRVQDEQRAPKARFSNLLPFAKEPPSLLADVAEFLRDCSDAFGRLAVAPKIPPIVSTEESLQQEISQLIVTAPTSWPPLSFSEFLQRISQSDRERIHRCVADSHPVWRVNVEEAFTGVKGEICEIIVLLRGIVEALQEEDPAAPIWADVGKLARELLPFDQFQIELVRDPKQPSEWFELPVEAEIIGPRVDRVGLAIRHIGHDWGCFPRGRLQIPRPIPRHAVHDAVASLIPITATHSWLSRLMGRLASFTEHPPDDWLLLLLDDLVADIADACSSIHELSSDQRQALDAILDRLQQSAMADHLQILPRKWRFVRPLTFDELQDDEKNHVAMFRPDEERGVIYRVRAVGLKRHDEIVRPCAVAVSAGPLPFGFRELENLIKDDPNELALRERLRAWRDAALAQTLELTAVQFLVDFSASLGEGLRQRDPIRAREFGERLIQLLQHEFRLTAFYPIAFQDFPDGWIQRMFGRPITTGLVRRLVRPGLHDDQNHLRLPALVEVE